jgi:hypothetical protein
MADANCPLRRKITKANRSEMLGNVLAPLLARIGEDAEA